jgi:hypothetical protein
MRRKSSHFWNSVLVNSMRLRGAGQDEEFRNKEKADHKLKIRDKHVTISR